MRIQQWSRPSSTKLLLLLPPPLDKGNGAATNRTSQDDAREMTLGGYVQ
jgi:hypothetical protein